MLTTIVISAIAHIIVILLAAITLAAPVLGIVLSLWHAMLLLFES